MRGLWELLHHGRVGSSQADQQAGSVRPKPNIVRFVAIPAFFIALILSGYALHAVAKPASQPKPKSSPGLMQISQLTLSAATRPASVQAPSPLQLSGATILTSTQSTTSTVTGAVVPSSRPVSTQAITTGVFGPVTQQPLAPLPAFVLNILTSKITLSATLPITTPAPDISSAIRVNIVPSSSAMPVISQAISTTAELLPTGILTSGAVSPTASGDISEIRTDIPITEYLQLPVPRVVPALFPFGASKSPTATVVPAQPSILVPTPTPMPIELPAPATQLPVAENSAPTPAPRQAPALTLQPTPDGTVRTAHVPILMYHYLSIPPANADIYRKDLSVAPALFAKHLDAIQKAGYTSISLYDLVQNLTQGTPLPEKPVIITFDDGYRDNYENAFPLLEQHGTKATFFVITDFIDQKRPEYLTWDMVREMFAAGMSIESHSRNHVSLKNRDKDYLVWQALGSMETIQYELGVRPRFIAYPAGEFDQLTIDIFHSANYWGAVTTMQGATHTSDNLFQLHRVRVRGTTTPRELLRLLALDW